MYLYYMFERSLFNVLGRFFEDLGVYLVRDYDHKT